MGSASSSEPVRRMHAPGRIAALLLLAAFVAGFVWWMLYIPYDPAALLRAIPSNAVFVSAHERVAERWAGMSRNPLTTGLLQTLGVEPKAVAAIIRDRGTQQVLDRLGATRTYVCYVPSFGTTGRPAWIVASWVGIQGQYLKWGFFGSALAAFDRVRFDTGREGWRLKPVKGWRTRESFSMMVSDGVLLGCLSTDSNAVAMLALRLEGRVDPYPAFRDQVLAPLERETWPDRGWVVVPGAGGGTGGIPHGMNIAIDLSSRAGTQLRLREPAEGSWLWPHPAAAPGPGLAGGLSTNSVAEDLGRSAGELGGIMGDFSCATVVAPFAYARDLLGARATSLVARVAGDLLDACAADVSHVSLTLCSPDYSGRVKGLRVPTVMAGFRLRDPARADERVGVCLDSLNARFGLNVIASSTRIGANRLIPLDSVAQGSLMGQLAREERPAFGLVSNWLFLASNRFAIETRLAEIEGQTAIREVPLASKPPGVGIMTAGVTGWMEIEPAAVNFTRILAFYDLISYMQGTHDRPDPLRADMQAVSRWLHVVAPLKALTLWSKVDAERAEVWLKLGGPAAGALAPAAPAPRAPVP